MDFKILWLAILVFVKNIRCQSEKKINSFEQIKLYVEGKGYKLEEHKVETEDKYLLTYYRIKSEKPLDHKLSQKPVLLQHSLVTSSADFLVPDKNATAFVLVDAGFDVWLGNSRGNQYSRRHVSLDPEKREYWNFGVDQLALDVAAGINYILRITQTSQVLYVGHSHGAMYPLILAASRPEYIPKVAALVALAPAYSMSMSGSDAAKMVLDYIESLAQNKEENKFLMTGSTLERDFCFLVLEKSETASCDDILESLRGSVSQGSLDNAQHLLFGTSKRAIKNVEKQVENGGILKTYNFAAVKYPVHIFYAEHDAFVTPEDINNLKDNLRSATLHLVKEDKFNHMDFVWGTEAKRLISKPLSEVLTFIVDPHRKNIAKSITRRRRKRSANPESLSPRSKTQSPFNQDISGLLNRKVGNITVSRDVSGSVTQRNYGKPYIVKQTASSSNFGEKLTSQSQRFLYHEKENYIQGPSDNSGKHILFETSYRELLQIIEEYKLFIDSEYRIRLAATEGQDVVFMKVKDLYYMLRAKGTNCVSQCIDLLELLSKNKWLQMRLNSLESSNANWQTIKTENSELTVLLKELKIYEQLIRSHGIVFETNESESSVIKKLQHLLDCFKSNCFGECKEVYTKIYTNHWFIKHVTSGYLFKMLNWKLLETENGFEPRRNSYEEFIHSFLKYNDYFECKYNIVIDANQSDQYYIRQLFIIMSMMERENKCNGICQDIKKTVRRNEWVNQQISITRTDEFQQVASSVEAHNDYIQNHYNINLRKFMYNEDYYYKEVESLIRTIERTINECSRECKNIYHIIIDSDWWKHKQECQTPPRKPIETPQLPDDGHSNFATPPFKPDLPIDYFPTVTLKPDQPLLPTTPEERDPKPIVMIDPNVGKYIEENRLLIQTQYNISFGHRETVTTFVYKLQQLQQQMNRLEHCSFLCSEMKSVLETSQWFKRISTSGESKLINQAYIEVVNVIKLKKVFIEKEFKITVEENNDPNYLFGKMEEILQVINNRRGSCIDQCEKIFRFIVNNEWFVSQQQLHKKTSVEFTKFARDIEKYISFIRVEYNIELISNDNENSYFRKVEMLEEKLLSLGGSCINICEELLNLIKTSEWYINKKQVLSLQKSTELVEVLRYIEMHKHYIQEKYGIKFVASDSEVDVFKKLERMVVEIEENINSCKGECRAIYNFLQGNSWFKDKHDPNEEGSNFSPMPDYRELLGELQQYLYYIGRKFGIKISKFESETTFIEKVESLVKKLKHLGKPCIDECKSIYEMIINNAWYQGQVRGRRNPQSELKLAYEQLLQYIETHKYFIEKKYGISFITYESEISVFTKLERLFEEIERNIQSCVRECTDIYNFLKGNKWFKEKYEINKNQNNEVSNFSPTLDYRELLEELQQYLYYIEREFGIKISKFESETTFIEKVVALVKKLKHLGKPCIDECKSIYEIIINNAWYQGQVRGRRNPQSELGLAYEQLLQYIETHKYFIKTEYTIEFQKREDEKSLFEKLFQIVAVTEQSKYNCGQCKEIAGFIKANRWYKHQYEWAKSKLKIYTSDNKETAKLMKNFVRFKNHLKDFYHTSE